MFNLIQLQDRLRGFSEDQLKQFLRTPDPSIPDFMVMAALDEKNDAKVQEAQMKAQNQPSKLSFTLVAPRVRPGEAMDQPNFPLVCAHARPAPKLTPKFTPKNQSNLLR